MYGALASLKPRLPLLIASDCVNGHGNLQRATLFPHHIGQGCMRDANGELDTQLVAELAAIAARETAENASEKNKS